MLCAHFNLINPQQNLANPTPSAPAAVNHGRAQRGIVQLRHTRTSWFLGRVPVLRAHRQVLLPLSCQLRVVHTRYAPLDPEPHCAIIRQVCNMAQQLAVVSSVLALAALLVSTTRAGRGEGNGPCDILAAAGNPCVAAHSTVRALYSGYRGPVTAPPAPPAISIT